MKKNDNNNNKKLKISRLALITSGILAAAPVYANYEDILVLEDKQTHIGDINHNTPSMHGSFTIANKSSWTGNANLTSENTYYLFNITEDSRWDGELNASGNVHLMLRDSVKTGGININRRTTEEQSNHSISISNSKLEGPIIVSGMPIGMLNNTGSLYIGADSGSQLDLGPQGLVIDNGMNLNINLNGYENNRINWKGDIDTRINPQWGHESNAHSQLHLSHTDFEGNVNSDSFGYNFINDSTWKGDLTIHYAEKEEANATNTNLNLYNSTFNGNVDQKASSISLNVQNSQLNGDIKIQAAQYYASIYDGTVNGSINYDGNAQKPDETNYFGINLYSNATVNGDININNPENITINSDMFSSLNSDLIVSTDTSALKDIDIQITNNSQWNGVLDLSKVNNIASSTEEKRLTRKILLGEGSVWTGHIVDGANKDIRIQLDSNKGKYTYWDMTGNSDIALLENMSYDNGSKISFVNADAAASKVEFHTLTTDKVKGNFDFNMRVGATGAERDQLVINDIADGNVTIKVKDNPSAKISGLHTYQMVDATNANTDQASFTLTNTDMKLELGGFVYDMITTDLPDGTFLIDAPIIEEEGEDEGNGNNGGTITPPVVIPPAVIPPVVTPPIVTPPIVTPPTVTPPSTSGGSNAGLSSVAVSYMMNDLSVHSLQQRMGDLRNTAGLDNNVWLKNYNGKFEHKESQSVRNFDMDYNAVQGGIDTKIVAGQNSRIHAGVMLGYNNADVDYNRDGNGKAKQFNAGIYGTYINDNGVYVDGTLSYGRLTQDINANLQSGGTQSASATKDVYSASIAAGKRIFANDTKQGFYIEPQAQLAVSHNEGMKFDTDKGLTVDINNYTSIQSRAGVQVGYEFGKEVAVNVYAKSQWVHDVSDDIDYKLNDVKGTYSAKGDRMINSVGASATMAKQHQIYTEVSHEDNSQFNHVQGHIGYRFNF